MGWTESLEKAAKGKLKKNALLSEFTALGVGGKASYLYKAETVVDLVWAISVARGHGAPYRIIGRGTNVIFSDNDFEGLVIVNATSELSLDERHSRVIVDSGVPLSRMILDLASKGYGGMESFISYRGTVGGAMVKNFSSADSRIADHLILSSVLVSSEKILSCRPVWFQFGRGKSKLSHRADLAAPVILNSIFQLQRRKSDDILKSISETRSRLKRNEPEGQTIEVFQNPAGSEKPAEYFLKLAGAKRMSVGQIRVSRKNANFIESGKHANALEARKLVEKMREAVSTKYNLDLVEKVEYLGEWNE